MPAVQWLLQRNHPNRGTISELERLLEAEGLAVFKVDLAPRAASIPSVHGLDPELPVVCYGPSFVPRAHGRQDLRPGIFFDPDAFRWTTFSQCWRELMLSDGRAYSVDEALKAISSSVFMRPDADSKAFDGGLYGKDDAAVVLQDALVRGRLTEDDLVVVAVPVAIDAEWRTFVVDGEVVAASSYRVDGRADIGGFVPFEVTDLASEAAALWSPASVFCLDIAQAGDRYGIVEANCFNASRFYAADVHAIVHAVTASVSGRYEQDKAFLP